MRAGFLPLAERLQSGASFAALKKVSKPKIRSVSIRANLCRTFAPSSDPVRDPSPPGRGVSEAALRSGRGLSELASQGFSQVPGPGFPEDSAQQVRSGRG